MTLLDGCRAMPEKREEKVRCDECKMTIPILLSLQGPSGALCTTKAPIADEKVTREVRQVALLPNMDLGEKADNCKGPLGG